jgi:hypothetical protein
MTLITEYPDHKNSTPKPLAGQQIGDIWARNGGKASNQRLDCLPLNDAQM